MFFLFDIPDQGSRLLGNAKVSGSIAEKQQKLAQKADVVEIDTALPIDWDKDLTRTTGNSGRPRPASDVLSSDVFVLIPLRVGHIEKGPGSFLPSPVYCEPGYPEGYPEALKSAENCLLYILPW